MIDAEQRAEGGMMENSKQIAGGGTATTAAAQE